MANALRWLDGMWAVAEANDLGESLADMEETVYARNSGVIGADGGPCPLIGILNRERRAAAVIHVLGGLVEMNQHPYMDALEALHEYDPVLFDGAEAVVCMDKIIPFVEESGNSGSEARTRYCRKVVRRLKKLIPNTRQVMKSDGKSLRIDITTPRMCVIDDADRLLFEM